MIDKQINVLYVAHDANLYGSNQSLFYLVKELSNRYNINPIVLVPCKGKFTQKLEDEKIEYIVVSYCLWQAVYKNGFRFVIKTILRRIKNLFAKKRIKKIIKGKTIDLVHSNSSVVEMGAECAAILKIPHIWHIREFGQEGWGMQYMYSKRYVCKKYSMADVLVTVSKELEKKFRKEYPKCTICTIYNGIPLEKIAFRENRTIDTINFCQIGYISAVKNQLQVLQACKILKEVYHLDFKMNFIGSGNGEYYQEFINYINENDLESCVKLWGFQEHVEKILPHMDVGIMSSRKEGFGRVTIEYMMSKIPVIGLADGGTKELIYDGVTGFLYHTVEELTKYMLFFAQNKSKVAEMGNRGYIRAKAEFTATKNADLIYSIYQDTLKQYKMEKNNVRNSGNYGN